MTTQRFNDTIQTGRPRHDGFTLIEIMVVMLLIAIAGSLVLMNVGQSGRLKQSRLFVESLVTLCKVARTASKADAYPVCLTIEPKQRICRVAQMGYPGSSAESTTVGGDRAPYGENEIFIPMANQKPLAIPERVRIESTKREGEQLMSDGQGVFYICFYPDGSSTGGRLSIGFDESGQSGENDGTTFQVDRLTGSINFVDSDDG